MGWCWMCKVGKDKSILGPDGFHYHGQSRCKNRKWRAKVRWVNNHYVAVKLTKEAKISIRKPNPAKKLHKLLQHTDPKRLPDLVNTLQEIGLNTNITRSILKAYQEYKETLKTQMSNVPHYVEKSLAGMDLPHGVRTIRHSVKGLGLQEGLWFYDYFTRGITPWFLE